MLMPKPARRSPSPVQRRASQRSLRLLREFAREGETLGLADSCELEFPEAAPAPARYTHFVVHYRPRDGLYAGGEFRFDFDAREVNYPMAPPRVRCLTPVWHPNIAPDGRVCHNFLQVNEAYGDGAGYTPALGLRDLVLAVETMFDVTRAHHSDSFNPADPLNHEAAEQFARDPRAFEQRVRDYVRSHAQPVPIPAERRAQKD